MSRLWGEFLGVDIWKLKQHAFNLKKELESAGWFKRFSIRKQLNRTLDEIDYQEGRLQFANRPYSFPTVHRRNCSKDYMICRCGCWATARENIFKL